MKEKEEQRLINLKQYECELRSKGYKYICGIDEAGRGPLAGPVVVASVIMPENSMIEGVNDSKKVSEKKREKLYDLILSEAISYGVGIIGQDEIDEINILNATKKGLTISLQELTQKPDLIIVDGGKAQITAATTVLKDLNLNIPVCGLVKNDKHRTSDILYNDKLYEIDKTKNLFHMLERIQDEVHNFTIRYHRDIRSKGALASILDDIKGIGEKRKKELLKKYSNINKMKEATVDDLSKILPYDIAYNLHEFLKGEFNEK